MNRAAFLLLIFAWLLHTQPSQARAKIITDPNDPDIHTMPISPFPTQQEPPAPVAPQPDPATAATCPPDWEGRTRYNGAANVKGIEFCDGAKWIGLMKLAPSANEQPLGKCAAGDESLLRYNKRDGVKAYEYCDGTTWRRLGAAGTLPISSRVFDKPSLRDPRHPSVLANGAFKEDGYVGAYLACHGGSNHFSLYLTMGNDPTLGANNDKVVAATTQNNLTPLNDIDQASLFSYVPRGMPWRLWLRSATSNTSFTQANCSVKLTVFGN